MRSNPFDIADGLGNVSKDGPRRRPSALTQEIPYGVQRHMVGLSILGIAGSDPIGDTQAPLPPGDLFGLFQSQTHIVYVTGDADTINIDNDGSSMQSMLRWCVFDVCTVGMARAGHSPSESNQADRRGLR